MMHWIRKRLFRQCYVLWTTVSYCTRGQSLRRESVLLVFLRMHTAISTAFITFLFEVESWTSLILAQDIPVMASCIQGLMCWPSLKVTRMPQMDFISAGSPGQCSDRDCSMSLAGWHLAILMPQMAFVSVGRSGQCHVPWVWLLRTLEGGWMDTSCQGTKPETPRRTVKV